MIYSDVLHKVMVWSYFGCKARSYSTFPGDAWLTFSYISHYQKVNITLTSISFLQSERQVQMMRREEGKEKCEREYTLLSVCSHWYRSKPGKRWV